MAVDFFKETIGVSRLYMVQFQDVSVAKPCWLCLQSSHCG